MHERRQFRVLYRGFLMQIVDPELLSARGEPSRLLVQIAAMLGALSFVLMTIILRIYVGQSPTAIALYGWGLQEFLMGTTMAVVGMFSVLAWDSIFPNRRDSLVLGILPIRARSVFLARVAATATGLGVSVLAVNIMTGFSYPFAAGGVRTFFAYWAAVIAAGLFVFCSLLALQGIAALVFSYRWFLKVSNALQVISFFSILAAFFLTPGPAEMDYTGGGEIPAIARRIPSFWFVGLFERWNHSPQEFFQPLGARAAYWLVAAVLLAVVIYTIAYRRIML